MDQVAEKECAALASLFQQIIIDMKSSTPIWEDFTAKATRLQVTLRSTVIATSAFLEAFQKVADMATNTRGATRDIGSALTRLCMRHRSIEHKLKTVTGSMLELMVTPIQEKLEDWKKIAIQLDKEHSKETKKAQQEVRKAASDTTRLQKKVKKGRADVQGQLDAALEDLRQKTFLLREVERNAVRAAMLEERARYCLFISAIKPLMDGEISLLGDVTHLQEIMDSLCSHAADPQVLPATSEQVVMDVSGGGVNWTSQTPPRSPALSMTSSKSSLSSMSSTSLSQSPVHQKHVTTSEKNSPSDTESPTLRRSVTLAATTQQSSPQSAPVQSSEHVRIPSWPTAFPICGHRCISGPQTGGGNADGNAEHLTAYTAIDPNRPHTISSAYERLHMRSALTNQTFVEPIYRQHPAFIGHICTAGGGGTIVHGVPYSAIAHHRSLAMVAPRPRPHSISRDVRLDEMIYHARKEQQVAPPGGGGTCANGPAMQAAPADDITPGEARNRVHSFSDGQPSCTETVKSLTEAIKRLEANARDEDFDALSSSSAVQRALHHSMSCGTIIVDHRTVKDSSSNMSNTTGNFAEDILRGIPRRSSMYIPTKPPSPVRRAMSMVVPMSVDDSIMTRYCDEENGDALAICPRMTQSDIVLHKSSAGDDDQTDDDETGCFFEDGILLPPSPFRSPDFAGDGDTSNGNDHVIESTGFRADRFGIALKNGRPFPKPGEQNSSAEDGRERQLPWMPVCSPDDVTPTNENQPQGFGTVPSKSSAPVTGCTTVQSPTPNSSMSERTVVADQYQSRYSEL